MTLDSYQCVGEIQSQHGIARMFTDWKADGEPNGIPREQFFRRQLKAHIDRLAGQVAHSLDGIPVVISGMASSSIGMADVAYATLPFAADGSQASIRHFDAQPDFPWEIKLVSGVSSQQDVMRGEETQLIGLLTLLDQANEQTRKAIFIFPGTHAKHMAIEHDQLVHFDTFMTGELFHLLANQSILADSVDISNLIPVLDSEMAAFKRGVRQSKSSPILNSLFTVRTNELFNKLTKRQNALYLSGLLIGQELGHLVDKPDWPIVLCSGSNLAVFYKLAIDELQLSERTTTVLPDLIDRAASVGQIRLYQHQLIKQTTE
ncbi:hypothetical protein GCM10027423_58100 [Spirosoma arcticum]